MNYLAHLFCSPGSPDVQLGSFIADFVKGRVDGRFPRAVAEGIRDHRKADLFTDSHEFFSASRRLISRERRRFAGVIIDVLYDHFLTTGWDRYASVGLDEFVGTVYANLGRHEAPLPHPVPLVIGRMVREDWLRSYGTVDGLDRTFWRNSRRLSRENTLGSAVAELEANYSALHVHFHRFFPDLLAHVKPAHHD
jgi:acyl carrier protein phosphodiesterase